MNIITLYDEVNSINVELTDVQGLQELTQTVSLSEDKTVTFSVTGEMSIIGNSGYAFLRNFFFGCDDLCNNQSLKASIYISCCDTSQDFIIYISDSFGFSTTFNSSISPPPSSSSILALLSSSLFYLSFILASLAF